MDKDGGLRKHENSLIHKQCIASWQERQMRNEHNNDVSELLTNKVLEKRRYYVSSVIDAIRFVIENELAPRGSWSIESHVEEGIFRNLFEYTLHKDAKLRTCQDAMPKNDTYLSPLIRNELIEIIANLTRQEIVQDINSADAKFFTLLVDGTKDRKNNECISIAIRYVKNGQPRETLLSFETSKRLNANALAGEYIQHYKNMD